MAASKLQTTRKQESTMRGWIMHMRVFRGVTAPIAVQYRKWCNGAVSEKPTQLFRPSLPVEYVTTISGRTDAREVRCQPLKLHLLGAVVNLQNIFANELNLVFSETRMRTVRAKSVDSRAEVVYAGIICCRLGFGFSTSVVRTFELKRGGVRGWKRVSLIY